MDIHPLTDPRPINPANIEIAPLHSTGTDSPHVGESFAKSKSVRQATNPVCMMVYQTAAGPHHYAKCWSNTPAPCRTNGPLRSSPEPKKRRTQQNNRKKTQRANVWRAHIPLWQTPQVARTRKATERTSKKTSTQQKNRKRRNEPTCGVRTYLRVPKFGKPRKSRAYVT